MPLFLSKVFGRKKHEDSEDTRRTSNASLLEGKFEAVSPTVSPTATNFLDIFGKDKEKEKEGGLFGLSKLKSGPSSPNRSLGRLDELPNLTLNLPGPKDGAHVRALGVVFEADPESQMMLPDSEIGERRLSPLETLILVKACSQAITQRGLGTLGIMHPHWHSASPDIQRKLISLFIQSLAPKASITTLSPTPGAPASTFESELNFTRSPYDIAAVLRWGLRHLKLEGGSFGKEPDGWSWYTKFSQAERDASYPPKIYSEKLATELIPIHLELLSSTLEILSSLAAHSEANSTSGSKLSKFLGLWLLSAQQSDPKDDWPTFYARWERAGRILEHLFLARIRDEAVGLRMPTRLLELVRNYPYSKGTVSPDNLLPRPRFTTRQYDAFFVRVDSEVSNSTTPAKLHPLRLIVEAFKAEASRGNENDTAWEELKKKSLDEEDATVSSSAERHPTFNRIFADETLRLLSLIPADQPYDEPTSPILTLFSKDLSSHRPSFSLTGKDKAVNGDAATSTNGPAEKATASPPAAKAPPLSPITDVPVTTDWAQFSAAGFSETTTVSRALASTLLDADVEKTEPPAGPRKQSKKRKAATSPARGRRASPGGKPTSDPTSPVPAAEELVKVTSRSSSVTVIPLDEAFIDFWSDAVLDPISSAWPSFVICKLRNPITGLVLVEKPVEWLIIEHNYSQTPPLNSSAEESTPRMSKRSRPSSPKPSFRSDISGFRVSSTLAATRKKFSFLTGSRTGTTDEKRTHKKDGKSPKVGEMGEILSEEEENPLREGDAGQDEKAPGVLQKDALGIIGPGTAAVVAATAGQAETKVAIQQPTVKPSAPPASGSVGSAILSSKAVTEGQPKPADEPTIVVEQLAVVNEPTTFKNTAKLVNPVGKTPTLPPVVEDDLPVATDVPAIDEKPADAEIPEIEVPAELVNVPAAEPAEAQAEEVQPTLSVETEVVAVIKTLEVPVEEVDDPEPAAIDISVEEPVEETQDPSVPVPDPSSEPLHVQSEETVVAVAEHDEPGGEVLVERVEVEEAVEMNPVPEPIEDARQEAAGETEVADASESQPVLTSDHAEVTTDGAGPTEA